MTTRTSQQEAVVDWFRHGTTDLCVTARAGSGKTSTGLSGVLARPSNQSAMLCAFAKRIADELVGRLAERNAGPRVRAKTLHGIGYSAVSRAFRDRGLRVRVDGHREAGIALDLLGGSTAMEDEARTVGKLAALAKETISEDITHESLCDLALDFGLADTENEDDNPEQIAASRARVALDVIARSEEEVDGTISYADMLWLPIVKSWAPDPADLVFIDEAQDMTRTQLRLATRVCRAGGRIVIIGDDRQCIFSFRGADPGSLDRMATELRARRLALTVSFRCPQAVVAEAVPLVPDLRAAPGAIVGTVRSAQEAVLMASAQVGDFVLSRTNAPLARICLGLIRAGTPARIVGKEIGPDLVKLVRRMAKGRNVGDEIAGLIDRLVKWRDREVARAVAAKRQTRADYVSDQAETIIALSDGIAGVSALISLIERVFADDKAPRVTCSTIHRAKGLEADRVWVLAETLDKMRAKDAAQELEEQNLKYVAITRARRELVWVR